MTLTEFRDRHNPCREAQEWARENCECMADVWEKAPAEWLILVATRPGVLDDRMLWRFACWCARQVWPLLTDERSRYAVVVAERYAEGVATDEELAAAWSAAREAAREAAWAAEAAAASEAGEAAAAAAMGAGETRAAAAAAAAWATSGAAWSAAGAAARATSCAAWSAARAAAWSAARATSGAAWDTARTEQARYLRTNVSYPWEREEEAESRG